MPDYILPLLPYDYAALEPTIDAETMRLHHDKHYAAYVATLNAALKDFPDLQGQRLEPMLRRMNTLPEAIRTAVRNNGGGHFNHTLFWDIMTPGGSSVPTGALNNAIQRTFGGLDALKQRINGHAAKRFGSGWSWLIVNIGGELDVVSTANQDSPLMETSFPILGVDVWEHAYYLTYQDRRADYLQAWWNVVNWDRVAAHYKGAQQADYSLEILLSSYPR